MHVIVHAAKSAGLKPKDLGLDSEGNPSNQAPRFEFFVEYGGALDESFLVGYTMYEVNMADWIAQDLAAQSVRDGGESWTVEVYALPRTDGDSPTYAVFTND